MGAASGMVNTGGPSEGMVLSSVIVINGGMSAKGLVVFVVLLVVAGRG